jgi:hypothetical protein
MGKGGPRGPWDEENAIDDRKYGNEIERDGGGYRSTDETQSERLRSPYYPLNTQSVAFKKRKDQKKKEKERTQEIVQEDVDRRDEKYDTSGNVKQVLGLEIPPGDVVKSVGG